MRGMTTEFFEIYQDMLELNQKRQSSEKELQKLMQHLNINSKREEAAKKIAAEKKAGKKVKKNKKKEKRKDTKKQKLEIQKEQVRAETELLFDEAIEDLNLMFDQLKKVQYSDITLYYRHASELTTLSNRIRRARLNDDIKYELRRHIYEIVKEITALIEHFWIVSKSQSRELIELEELTVVSTRGERRRIRMQTIELDHMEEKLSAIKKRFTRLIKTKDLQKAQELQESIMTLFNSYQRIIELLEKTMHESKILLRRTEKLFKAMKAEAKRLGWEKIIKKIDETEEKMRKIFLQIEAQMRRERIDLKHLTETINPGERPKTAEQELTKEEKTIAA